MKYYEYSFHFVPFSEISADVLSALLADCGFETFTTEIVANAGNVDDSAEEYVLKAYIQQNLCCEEDVNKVLGDFPLPNVIITYDRHEPEDRDWNEEWESTGFDPITIGNDLLICDTRHVDHFEGTSFNHRLFIHPRQAFGTGSHETTRMLLRQLLSMNLEGKHIIDAGCGTGILSFLCLKLNAGFVFAYDIDEWSIQNTYDNATLNFADIEEHVLTGERLTIELGDSSCLDGQNDYDLLIANINRNILLSDMNRFGKVLRANGSQLLLSGFYRHDVPQLLQCAGSLGFNLLHEEHDGEWTMLLLER